MMTVSVREASKIRPQDHSLTQAVRDEKELTEKVSFQPIRKKTDCVCRL